jgi:FSR family fosmidomycin resistance protein-like MFS transporter
VKKTTNEPGKEEKESQGTILYLNLVLYYMSAVLLGFTYRGIMTFLPAYMGQKVQISFIELDTITLGGTAATFALLFGTIGQYIGGRLSDRCQPEKIYFFALVIGTFWVFSMTRTENILLVISAILYAFFYFATQPVQNYLLSCYIPQHRRGIGFGIHFFLAFGVGSTAAAISGYLADHFGLISVFYTMGLCYVTATVLSGILLLKTPRTAFK